MQVAAGEGRAAGSTKRAYREQDRSSWPRARRRCARRSSWTAVTLELFATAEAELRHPELVTDATAQGRARSTGPAARSWPSCPRPSPRRGCWPSAGWCTCRSTTPCPREPRLVAVLAHVRDPGNAGTVHARRRRRGRRRRRLHRRLGRPLQRQVRTRQRGQPVPPARRSSAHRWRGPCGNSGRGLRVLAADGAGKHTLDDVDLSGPTAWIFGNEAWGLPEEVLELADEVVSVPIYGRAESLNLATAAAVCLYCLRQGSASVLRRAGKPAIVGLVGGGGEVVHGEDTDRSSGAPAACTMAIDDLPDGLIMTDRFGRVLAVNRAAARLTGVTARARGRQGHERGVPVPRPRRPRVVEGPRPRGRPAHPHPGAGAAAAPARRAGALRRGPAGRASPSGAATSSGW